MLLYHGTDTGNLKRILADGIRPRPANGFGNWDTAPSLEGFVYLTTAFAPFYAMVPCVIPSVRVGINPLILEVDGDSLDEGLMHPDEDFLAQRIRIRKKAGLDVPEDWGDDVHASQDQWRESLHLLGTVSVQGGVPVKALTRYAVMDFGFRTVHGSHWTTCPCLYETIKAEHEVSIERHGQAGQRLRDLLAFIFGDSLFHGDPPMGYGGAVEAFRQAIEEERRNNIVVHRMPTLTSSANGIQTEPMASSPVPIP